ncbi:M23 family metallopeptidase, partial [Patescibacteria group bacterium]|nr:M23 family metallopeptidase [Patescibacteria group bacterium]MBU1922105.1 M23 family metallopeptidase [Patescibacteria group bacterium]
EEDFAQTVGEGAALVQPTISGADGGVSTRTKIEEYAVESGDTLNSIAEKFSLSLSTLLWANDLSSSSYIHPGDKLAILPVSGVLHTVSKGETVAGIAKKYSADAEKMVEFNKLADAGSIMIGDKLVVPGGKKPQPVKTTTSSYTAPVSSIFSSNPPASSSSGARTRLLWPTPGHVITQYYHWGHSGLDIDGDYSSPLYAAEAGTVEYAGWNGGYGIMVQINHGGGMVTRYGHASKLFVKKGDYVSRGQTIAMMGTTGWSTGTHLHFEVIIGGVKYNPLSYIR